MDAVKGVLLFVLFIVMLGAGFIVAIRYLPTERFNGQKVTAGNLVPVVQEKFAQAKETSGRVTEAGKVLGVKDVKAPALPFGIDQKVNDVISRIPSWMPHREDYGGGNVPDQAFEKARYEYCQQVITDYDSRYGTAAKSGTNFSSASDSAKSSK